MLKEIKAARRASKPDIGRVVGGIYKLSERIGKGSFGTVWLADDIKNKRLAAVKFLLDAQNKTIVEHFKNEFSILKELSHPNINRIYDFGRDKNLGLFYASEYIVGSDIFKATKGKDVFFIEELLIQALRSLSYIHSKGIFHFDIKYHNILISGTSSFQIKLIDFGLASLTPPQKPVGTLSFMAPEMLLQQTPDSRADLYSLGIVFYSLLTRLNPFKAATMDEAREKHLGLTPLPPSEFNNKIPPYLDYVICKLLKKNRADRYANAALAIRDLNLRAHKNYPVETSETLLSYIPYETSLVGRKKELTLVIHEVEKLKSGTQIKQPVIYVTGQRGTGKSRFLTELKYQIQLMGVDTSFTVETGNIPSTPTVFIFDDVKSLDDRRISLLINAVKQPIKPPLIMLIMAMTAPPEHVNDMIIKLVNFTMEELTEYLATLTNITNPPQKLIDLVWHTSSGNPWFVTEIVRELVINEILFDSSGRWKVTTFDDIVIDVTRLKIPASLKEPLIETFNRLSDIEKEITKIVATWDAPITLYDIERAFNLQGCRETLSHLTRKNILSYNSVDNTYQCANPLLARAVTAHIEENENRILHSKIANYLSHAKTMEQDLIDWHFSFGLSPPKGNKLLLKVAENYRNRGDLTKAIDILEQAISRTGQGSDISNLVLQLGRAQYEALQFENAIRTFGKLGRSSKVMEEMGVALLKAGRINDAKRHFTEGLELSREVHDAVQEIILENFIANVAYLEGRFDDAIKIYRSTAEKTSKLAPEQQCLVRNNDIGLLLAETGSYKEAVEILQQDLEFFRKSGFVEKEMRSYYILAETFMKLGDEQKAVRNLNAAMQCATKIHQYEYLLRIYNLLGNMALTNKYFAKAIDYYERAQALSAHIQDSTAIAGLCANLGIAYCHSGDLVKAEEYLDPVERFLKAELSPTATVSRLRCVVYQYLGEIAKRKGKFAEAEKHLSEAWTIAISFEAASDLKFETRLTQLEVAVETNNKKLVASLTTDLKKLAAGDKKLLSQISTALSGSSYL